MTQVYSRPAVSAPHRPNGTFLSSPKTASEHVLWFLLPAYRISTFTDDSTPFARLHGGEANPPVEHVTKGTSRARATTTIANANARKQPAVHLSSKRGQAARAAPTLMAGSTKKSPQINPPTRPATATGRMASTSRIGPVSIPRMHARPATSVSSRPPIAATRTVKLSTKSQMGATPLAADFEVVLKFEGVGSDVGNDDFMFDV